MSAKRMIEDRDKIRHECYRAITTNEKFRGERLFVPYFAELTQVQGEGTEQHYKNHWHQDDTLMWEFIVSETDLEIFPELKGIKTVLLKYDETLEMYSSDNNV